MTLLPKKALFSFAKSERLKKSSEFQRLSRSGNKLSGRYFIVLFSKNDGNHSKLGLTVSKKVSKLAVKRNRIKRVIREFFRTHKALNNSLDMVVIAKYQANTVENNDLFHDLSRLWQKLYS